MSTILKALRRLEQERAATGPRPLREEVATPSRAADGPRGKRWLPAVSIALGVGLASAAGVALWLGAPPETTDVAAEPAASAAPVPTEPTRVAVQPPRRDPRPEPSFLPPRDPEPSRVESRQELSSGLPEEAFASSVKVVQRPPAEPRMPIEIAQAAEPLPDAASEPGPPKTAPVSKKPEPVAKKSEPAPKPEPVAKKSEPAPKPEPVAKKPEPAPAPEPVAKKSEPAPKPEPVAKKSEPAPAPEPVAKKSEPAPKPEPVAKKPETAPKPEPVAKKPEPAPTPASDAVVLVEKTHWHPRAERRAAFVTLEGGPAQRLQEGDVVGRYVVSEIQPSGVIFLSDGKPLHRKVGAK